MNSKVISRTIIVGTLGIILTFSFSINLFSGYLYLHSGHSIKSKKDNEYPRSSVISEPIHINNHDPSSN